MTSSQRLYQYSKIKLEADLEKEIDTDLAKINWPAKGDIDFNDVTMRYREGLEPSISGL